MLLGRTANGLYWMQRYIERAENMARLVDAGLHIALTKAAEAQDEWASVVISAGQETAFRDKHTDCTAATVSDFLLRDRNNPSSVLSCIIAARSNARMVRTALTREAWESVNVAWLNLKTMLAEPVAESLLPRVLHQIKRETANILGSFHGTMLRNEIFNFASIGTYMERANSTARILDVKYYVLLPAVSYVGTSLDNHQWESILRSVSAHRSYRWVYGVEYKPTNIADYLILNGRMPRSLHFSYRMITQNLEHLAEDYGAKMPCHATAAATLSKLTRGKVADIFETGLHEFLTDFIAHNNRLGNEIAEAYNFY